MGRRIKNANKVLITEYNDLRKLSYDEKIEQAQGLAKRANTRLKALQKSGYDKKKWAYGKAVNYLMQEGRTTFYRGKNYDSEKELNRALQELTYFLNAKTSTIKGIHEIEKNRFKTFTVNHPNLPQNQYNNFYDFLQHPQVQLLFKMLPSNLVMDDFDMAMQQGQSLEDIVSEYANVTNGELTFEQVQERHGRAEWQLANNGGKFLK